MTYEKPEVEVVKFEDAGFMTTSLYFSSTAEALKYACTSGFDEPKNYNKFSCGVFGGYNSSEMSNGSSGHVVVGNNQYVFDYHGNHWACTVVN